MNTRRHPRTLMEAFPRDHWRGVIEIHRAPLLLRWWGPIANVLFVSMCAGALAWIAFYGLSGGWR